ncbi:MAG TPA: M48 family metalloprotease [Candidatus Elarobacter sp.]|nr:M48 family metalloprotease [Candidatus Elarobacter sp.]
MTTLFAGRESLRVPGERATFVWTLLSLPVTIIVVGWLLQHQLTWQEIALLLLVAMVYVAFARGRLLGGGLRIHAEQFGHVHAVVEECARMMRLPVPHVFIRDDPFVPVVAVGIGEPYAIVISAQYVDYFREDELRFLIGRELGHIASGHTRFTSLLSANGRENAIVSIAFGAWLRKIEYTADRAGLLCCGSLETAMRAIAVSTFGHVGRKADLGAFAGQLKELHAEPSLRMAEWSAASPYATNRIAALHRFARDPLFVTWAPRFAANAAAPRVEGAREEVYAGFWRRTWAFLIDVAVIQAIVPAAAAIQERAFSLKELATDSSYGPVINQIAKDLGAGGHTRISFGGNPMLWLLLAAYAVVLVALIGQTVGMMICDLRVIGANHDPRVGFARAIGRYISLVASLFAIVGWFAIFNRVQPYEKWSRTRLVSGSAAIR